MKKILGVYASPQQHWVGDGFPVRSLFSYREAGEQTSPFLLLDYAGPHDFAPAQARRGVGQHPHRGFETVTIVYEGEVEHRDSSGGGGVIGPGDVQWMTAAAGILHSEFHSDAMTRNGGPLEMVQLWVNLPARDKMAPPGYQTIVDKDIPNIPLMNGGRQAGSLRLISGDFAGQHGPAKTFTPIDVWDIRLNAGSTVTLPVAAARNAALVVLHGTGNINGQQSISDAQTALFERSGDDLALRAETDAVVLLLSGEPIDEPIVGHGPFVMNTQQEILQAMRDFQSGSFGRMPVEVR